MSASPNGSIGGIQPTASKQEKYIQLICFRGNKERENEGLTNCVFQSPAFIRESVLLDFTPLQMMNRSSGIHLPHESLALVSNSWPTPLHGSTRIRRGNTKTQNIPRVQAHPLHMPSVHPSRYGNNRRRCDGPYDLPYQQRSRR